MKKIVTIITAENQQEGLSAAKQILYKKIDSQTLLLLSGGSTPKDLYETLAKEGKLKSKAVGMVDERMDRSNYRMIKSTGLLDYLENLKIKFYPMIFGSSYDKDIRKLIDSSKNKVAIMGIGEDGHTAGLPARTQNLKLPTSLKLQGASKTQNYVTRISNFPGEFKERITLTFKALSKMDLLIVLAFGSAKQNALNLMFEEGSVEEVPARFYTFPEIAKKTILITDQIV